MSFGKWKDELHATLSAEERVLLAKLVNKLTGLPRRRLEVHFNQMTVSTLFGLLHREMFGNWATNNPAYMRVMENLEKLRIILKSIPRYPQIPYRLEVKNQVTGIVKVTVHAWERFCERFCPNALESDVVEVTMKGSFAKARVVQIDKLHAMRRLIAAKGEEAQYLLDLNIYCRFVVIAEGEGKSLVTAEIPND